LPRDSFWARARLNGRPHDIHEVVLLVIWAFGSIGGFQFGGRSARRIVGACAGGLIGLVVSAGYAAAIEHPLYWPVLVILGVFSLLGSMITRLSRNGIDTKT